MRNKLDEEHQKTMENYTSGIMKQNQQYQKELEDAVRKAQALSGELDQEKNKLRVQEKEVTSSRNAAAYANKKISQKEAELSDYKKSFDRVKFTQFFSNDREFTHFND